MVATISGKTKIKEALPINKKTIIAALLTAIAVFFIGAYVGATYFPQRIETIIEKPAEIKENVRHEVETIIQYVQKAPGENTDVEASITPPAVNVKVNGQPYTFNLLQNEKQKFEDGKLVLNQSSDIGIELVVKPQVIDKTKHGGIDLIAGKYSGIGIRHKRFGIDATVNVRDRNDVMIQGRWTVKQW